MNEEILAILRAYLDGEPLSEDERAVLDKWTQQSGYHMEAMELLEDKEFIKGAIRQMEAYAAGQDANWARLKQEMDREKDEGRSVAFTRPAYFLRRWGWAAAIVIILAGAGVYLTRTGHGAAGPQAMTRTMHDIPPGMNGAVLTLADGRRVVLDSAGNGVIAIQGSVVVKLRDGRVSYDRHSGVAGGGPAVYNTMTTPRGRQYQLVLPDGTKVWLNAASSLTYPTAFTGDERKVQVNGEAYFEVARDIKRPFRVKAGRAAEIEVLGTSFNVNAYGDETSVNTTLLEGSVRVVGKESVVMKPGEQTQVYNDKIRLVRDVDTAQAVAWKNGAFSFTDADLSAVMRQLARLYDVEVRYAGEIPQRTFTGDIGRSLSLEQVLRILAKNKIEYRIEEGRRITILP